MNEGYSSSPSLYIVLAALEEAQTIALQYTSLIHHTPPLVLQQYLDITPGNNIPGISIIWSRYWKKLHRD